MKTGIDPKEAMGIRLLRWLVILFLPPLAVFGYIVMPELLEVLKTGLCPPAPPDIGPYPCSVYSYLGRMLFGGFSLPFNLIVFGGWWVSVAALQLLRLVMRRIQHRRHGQ